MTYSELDQAAWNMRRSQEDLKEAQAIYEWSKEKFKRVLTETLGEGKQEFDNSDGYHYGRTVAQVGGGFDFDQLMLDHPEIALNVSKSVLDPEALEEYVERFPELLPTVQQYAIEGQLQERLLPITKVKIDA